MFKISKSVHDLQCVEKSDLTPEQATKVRNFILANHYDDPRYQAKSGVSPFLQGYDENPNGKCWVLIEFWSDQEDRIKNYVDLLNKEVFGSGA